MWREVNHWIVHELFECTRNKDWFSSIAKSSFNIGNDGAVNDLYDITLVWLDVPIQIYPFIDVI